MTDKLTPLRKVSLDRFTKFRRITHFPLPTELVIFCRGFDPTLPILPDMYRVVETYELWYKGMPILHEELAEIPNWKGTHGTPGVQSIYIGEVWEDWGDDGHTELYLVGALEFTAPRKFMEEVWGNPGALRDLLNNAWGQLNDKEEEK